MSRQYIKTNRNIPKYSFLYGNICEHEHESEQKCKRKFVKVGEKKKRA